MSNVSIADVERRQSLLELRDEIKGLKEIIIELSEVVAVQSARIEDMSREIAELRTFRSNAVYVVVIALGTVAWYLFQKFIIK
ncbi:hypothetical protein AWB76_00932 [Caballeronia temeraria]|uniref:Uncharacterized protein n=1 Tax=Caballeronia temeraria TaxID=1777137 RepID=A0A157ZM01_9BURK|nr:hypothetical protein [Caballeronia temeraria]SAK46538.1 hypothetical protein AWB76_00932 [Caballeronia temeraria]